MIEQAIEKIEEMAKAAQRVRFETVPGEPADVYAAVMPDGTFTLRRAEPGRRAYACSSVAGLVEAAEQLGGCTVFVSASGVFAVRDIDGDRRETASLTLTPTAGGRLIRAMTDRDRAGLDQAELIELLRADLPTFAPATALPAVRRLKFKRAAEGHSEVSHGGSSMGREIEAKATGADGDLPERIDFTVRVFEEHPFEATVPAVLIVDPESMRFRLRVSPDDWRDAVDSAVMAVSDTISKSAGVERVLCGVAYGVA